MPRRLPLVPVRSSVWALVLAALVAWPAAAQAVLVVETDPAGAVVTVGGEAVGESPVTVDVAPGAVEVSARVGRFEPAVERVTAVAGDTVRVTLRLVRETGRVRVEGLPAGATVRVEGQAATGAEATVPTGAREVRVALADGRTVAARVPVEVGQVTPVRFVDAVFTSRPALGNLAVPGMAQLRGGRPLVGGAYLAGLSAAFVVSVTGDARVQGAREDYEAALDRYGRTETEADAVAAWDEVLAEYDAVRNRERIRTVAVSALAAFYVASVADALLFHSRTPRLEPGTPGLAWEVGPSAEGLAVRLRF